MFMLVKRASIWEVMPLIRLIGKVFTPKVQETSLRSVKPWAGIDVCTTSISHSTHSHQSTELDEDLSSFLSAVLCRFRPEILYASILTLMLLATRFHASVHPGMQVQTSTVSFLLQVNNCLDGAIVSDKIIL